MHISNSPTQHAVYLLVQSLTRNKHPSRHYHLQVDTLYSYLGAIFAWLMVLGAEINLHHYCVIS